jgi:hypothetical protein
VFWVISAYFYIRNTLPKYGTFLPGHPVYDHPKSKEVKNRCNLAESPKESYDSERAVLPPLPIAMAVAMTHARTHRYIY